MRFRYGLVVLLLSLTACGAAPSPTPVPPTLPPSPTSHLRAVTPSGIRATLPPTFTPTYTPTNLPPPTLTGTPAPTGTFTPIPEKDLCADFMVVPAGLDGMLYRSGTRQFSMTFMAQVQDALVTFQAVHEASGQIVENDYPSNYLMQFTLDPQNMPASGRYDWTMSITQGGRTGLCEHSGYMVIDNTPLAEMTPDVEATAEITPEAESTAEATPEVTAETTPEATAAITPTARR